MLLISSAVSVFIRRPEEIDLLPPAVAFEGSHVTDVAVSERAFSSDTEDISPRSLSDLVAKSGQDVAFSRFHKLTYLFTSPEMVSAVLIDHVDMFLKGEEERALAAVIGWGLLAQEGQPHKTMQRALNPGVRGQILEAYLGRVRHVFDNHLDTLVESDAPLVEFSREVVQSAAEMSLFGLPQPTRDFRYHEAVLETNRFSMSEVTPGRYTSHERTTRFIAAKNILDQHIESLVEAWATSGSGGACLMEYIAPETQDLPDSRRRTLDQAGLFMQAATETTASLLPWMFLHLTNRDDVWKGLRNEAEGLGDEPITYDTLKSLEYHQAVVSESLRLTPPVWMIPRVVERDVTIAGIRLPRGARVILSPWVTHRLATDVTEPESFIPERWLGRNQFQSKGSYFPFGLGSRICIGEAYGRMAAAAILHTLTQRGNKIQVADPSFEIGISHLLSIPRLDLRLSVT